MTKVKRPTKSIKEKALKLTGRFEGGGLAGNFDGQVASWGVIQCNIGQGTLQPLLKRIHTLNPTRFTTIMGQDFVDALLSDKLRDFFFTNVLMANGDPKKSWITRFANLSNTSEAVQAQAEKAEVYMNNARRTCLVMGLETERGFAFAFDVAVQNGGVRDCHTRLYRQRIASYAKRVRSLSKMSGEAELPEWQRLKLWANCVAECSKPRWKADVLSRKLTIALGQGVVHGSTHNLQEQYDISPNRKWYAE